MTSIQRSGSRPSKPIHHGSAPQTYDADFVAWAEHMATLLQRQQFDQLDLVNLIDEIQDLSRRERQALFSNLKIILIHLLKWQYQATKRSNSWKASIREHRQRIVRQIHTSPSLKPYLTEIYLDCYQDARAIAADETGLPIDRFPHSSSFTVEQALDPDYLP